MLPTQALIEDKHIYTQAGTNTNTVRTVAKTNDGRRRRTRTQMAQLEKRKKLIRWSFSRNNLQALPDTQAQAAEGYQNCVS